MKNKLKIVLVSTLAVGILAVGGAQAMAVTTQSSSSNTTSNADCNGDFKRKGLTDEQKAKLEEMRQKMEASNEKWNSLTDAQKSQVYAITDKISELQKQLADKYAELGIIDSDTAKQQKEDITKRQTELKESKRLPMLGFRKGGRGPRGEMNPSQQPQE